MIIINSMNPDDPPNPLHRSGLNPPQRAQAVPRLSSRELFRNSKELVIEHQGQEYRLRLTRNDKLILNK